jgi:hypothetical protein
MVVLGVNRGNAYRLEAISSAKEDTLHTREVYTHGMLSFANLFESLSHFESVTVVTLMGVFMLHAREYEVLSGFLKSLPPTFAQLLLEQAVNVCQPILRCLLRVASGVVIVNDFSDVGFLELLVGDRSSRPVVSGVIRFHGAPDPVEAVSALVVQVSRYECPLFCGKWRVCGKFGSSHRFPFKALQL